MDKSIAHFLIEQLKSTAQYRVSGATGKRGKWKEWGLKNQNRGLALLSCDIFFQEGQITSWTPPRRAPLEPGRIVNIKAIPFTQRIAGGWEDVLTQLNRRGAFPNIPTMHFEFVMAFHKPLLELP